MLYVSEIYHSSLSLRKRHIEVEKFYSLSSLTHAVGRSGLLKELGNHAWSSLAQAHSYESIFRSLHKTPELSPFPRTANQGPERLHNRTPNASRPGRICGPGPLA